MIFAARPELEWRDVFGNDHPVELEIGSGKGAFLIAHARAHPQRNFVAIENQPRWARWIAERLRRAPLANVRVVCADASVVIANFVRDSSVAAYHVLFPDPWWKRRHHKRRLVKSALAVHLFRTLEPGGVVHVATDVGERFADMRSELATQPFVVKTADAPTPAGRALSNFERKYRAAGRRLYYATFTKPT
jgi:tRNA (guanine-N7-)-methyltransferase